MAKIISFSTRLEIAPEMPLIKRGPLWLVRVPANNTQVCEIVDVDPVDDVSPEALRKIVNRVLNLVIG